MGTWQINVTFRDGSTMTLHYPRNSPPPTSGSQLSLPDPREREPGKEIALQIVGGVRYSPPHERGVGIWEFEATEV